MALTYSYLHASQGSDVVFTIALVNSNGSKLNLTGYTVRGKYARSHSSVADPTNIILTTPGNYVYDVETVDSEDKVERVLEGLLEISASVTT